jgi:hypothetical protein
MSNVVTAALLPVTNLNIPRVVALKRMPNPTRLHHPGGSLQQVRVALEIFSVGV